MIELDTGQGAGSSSLSLDLPNVGDSVVVGVVDYIHPKSPNPIQGRDYATGEPATWDDGSPKYLHMLVGLVKSPNEAWSRGEDGAPLAAGDEVTIWLEGGRFVDWRDWLNDYRPANGFGVGHVIKITREPDQEPSRRGYQPRKSWSFAGRPPTGDDGTFTAECEAAHTARKAAASTQLDTGPTASFDDGDPF